MYAPTKQFDLFPTSEPEIKGQLAAFAVVLRGLIDSLVLPFAGVPHQASGLSGGVFLLAPEISNRLL